MDERRRDRTYFTNNDQEGIFHPSRRNTEPVEEVVEEEKHVTPTRERVERNRYIASSIAPARRVNTAVYEDTFLANRIVQLVYYLGGLLSLLVGLRFVLKLLGAAQNSFVSFIYQLTEPLVAPFRGIFGQPATVGAARFEVESLVSIIVIGIVTFALAGLIQLLTRDNTEA